MIEGCDEMPINQSSLNSILSMAQSKSNYDILTEKQNGILKKLNQLIDNSTNDKTKVDNKQLISELQETNKQIQQAIYDEKTTQLELQRLQLEEETGKSYRDRERAFAKHEDVLLNASMSKLFSAKSKLSQFSKMAGGKITIKDMANMTSQGAGQNYLPKNLLDKVDDINRDLKESAEYGKAAAEVARRRKKNQLKADLEESHKRKKKHINVSV